MGIAAQDSDTTRSARPRRSRSRGDETIDKQYGGREHGRNDKENDHRKPNGREDGLEPQRIEPQQVDKKTAQYDEYRQNNDDRRRKYEKRFFQQFNKSPLPIPISRRLRNPHNDDSLSHPSRVENRR